jgi:hypothetical protein
MPVASVLVEIRLIALVSPVLMALSVRMIIPNALWGARTMGPALQAITVLSALV